MYLIEEWKLISIHRGRKLPRSIRSVGGSVVRGVEANRYMGDESIAEAVYHTNSSAVLDLTDYRDVYFDHFQFSEPSLYSSEN